MAQSLLIAAARAALAKLDARHEDTHADDARAALASLALRMGAL